MATDQFSQGSLLFALSAGQKVCRRCRRELPLDAFELHANCADGRRPVCLECVTPKYPGGKKTCSRCGAPKSLEQFPVSSRSRDGHEAWCKVCKHESHLDYLKRNRATIRAKARAFHATPEGKAALRRRNLRVWYGITPEDYERILDAQERKCALCRSSDARGLHGRFQVDHCHKTGKIRGLLCAFCNKMLGLFKDDSHAFRRVAEYLDPARPNLVSGAKGKNPPERRKRRQKFN